MKKNKLIPTLIGMGLLAGLVAWIGPVTLWEQFYSLRWVLPVLVASGLTKHALRTWAWKETLKAEGADLEFIHLLRIRIASQSLAYLSSMGALVSEPLKPWMLRKAIPVENTIPATLVENVVYWTSSLFVTTMGAFVAIHIVAEHHNAIVLSIICFIIFIAVVLLFFARAPFLTKLISAAGGRKILGPKWESLLRKAGDMERQIRSFRVRHPGVMVRILGINLLVQVVMLSEVWIVLHTISVPVYFFQLAAIEAASRMVKMMSFYIPGRLGADEAGIAGSFLLLGLPAAAGLTLAIARRLQALSWVAVGVVWLSRAGSLSESLAGFQERRNRCRSDYRSSSIAREDIDHAGAYLVAQDR